MRLPPMPALTTDTRDPCACMQTTREHVRPSIVAVQRRPRAIGDRIAEARDHERRVRRHDVDRVEEVPRSGRERKRRIRLLGAVAAAARRRQVGRLQRLRMPGHRTGGRGGVEADRQLAAIEERRRGAIDEGQRHRIAPGGLALRNRDGAAAAVERHGLVGPGNYCTARRLQPDEHVIEGHGRRAKCVREAQPHPASPQIGPDDQAERLIDARRGPRTRRRRRAPAARPGCRRDTARARTPPRTPPTSAPREAAVRIGPRTADRPRSRPARRRVGGVRLNGAYDPFDGVDAASVQEKQRIRGKNSIDG